MGERETPYSKMSKWDNLNKVRIHNRNETTKHFLIKALSTKLLFGAGYEVYTEDENNFNYNTTKSYRVSDVKAMKSRGYKKGYEHIVIEIETSPTNKHINDLKEFYKDKNLYIIKAKEISDNITEMEKQIKHILGI